MQREAAVPEQALEWAMPSICLRRTGLALIALAALAHAPAASAAEPFVQVDGAWVRGTVEGQTGSGAYLRLTAREDARLVGAASPVAQKVEIHEMRMVGDRMIMRRSESLPLPAHATVALEHEYHVMFIGLKRQLRVGESVAITLDVLDLEHVRERIERPLATPAPGAAHG